jgi:hypothetical protein
MEDNPRHGARSRGRVTPFVQGGLALLVAGTLIMFSFLAFRTGFAEQPRGGVAAREPDRTGRGPVLLPSPGDGSRAQNQPSTVVAQAPAEPDDGDQRVLGTRIQTRDSTAGDSRTEESGDLDTRRKVEAREEDGSEAEDHGDDDDGNDDSGHSRSWSDGHSRGGRDHSDGGSRHSKGSRGHSKGSRHHSNGSRG